MKAAGDDDVANTSTVRGEDAGEVIGDTPERRADDFLCRAEATPLAMPPKMASEERPRHLASSKCRWKTAVLAMLRGERVQS